MLNLCFSNNSTFYALGYKGYSNIGAYISDIFINKYGKIDNGVLSIKYNPKTDAEEWESIFLDEIDKGIKYTTDRIKLNEKKNKVKKKIQEIESDIDNALIEYIEVHKNDGVVLVETDKKYLPKTIVYEWCIKKPLHGYGHFTGPGIYIRKTNTGKYLTKYKETEKFDCNYTNWKTFKSKLAKEDMMYYVEEYFSTWINIPPKVQFNYVTENFVN